MCISINQISISILFCPDYYIVMCNMLCIPLVSPVTVVDGLDGGVSGAGAEAGLLRAGQLGRARAGSSQVLSLQPGDPHKAFQQGDAL